MQRELIIARMIPYDFIQYFIAHCIRPSAARQSGGLLTVSFHADTKKPSHLFLKATRLSYIQLRGFQPPPHHEFVLCFLTVQGWLNWLKAQS